MLTRRWTHFDTPLLTVFKAVSYLASVFLFVAPLAGWPARVAAAAAVPVGFALCHMANRHRLRMPVLLSAALLLAAFGLASEGLLGCSSLLPRCLGVQTTLAIASALTLSLLALSVTFLLRTLASRWPTLVCLEAGAVMAIVVTLFAAHRDSNISQPRFFADWALGGGYEPRRVLIVIGLLTAAAMILLLVRTEHGWRALAALLLLAGTSLAAFALLTRYLPDYGGLARQHQSSSDPAEKDKKSDDHTSKRPRDAQGPSGEEPDHGDGQVDRDSMSFDPRDWPNHPKPMAIVTLHDDYRPPLGYFYFRQSAYSQFNGQKLVRAVMKGPDADVPREFPQRPTEVVCAPFDEKLAQAVPTTISLMRPHARPLALANPQSLDVRQNADPNSFERTYFARSLAPRLHPTSVESIGRRAGDTAWSEAELAHYLHGPSDPRYQELAEQIVATIDAARLKPEFRSSPVLKAMAIRRWLEQNMVYSLAADHSGAADPVASFLFGNRRGYCVHVAHAMTYLLRTQKIPARVGAGYAVDAGRPGHGSAILLQCTDLHAWCEVYLEGAGWTIMDAALEQSESPPPPPADIAAQSFYGERNRPQFDPDHPAAPADISAEEATGRSRRHALWLLLLFFALVALYAVKVWRLVIPRFSRQRQLYRVCYRASADRLGELGLARQFGETREEFAQRVADWSPEFLALSEAHVRQALSGVDSQSNLAWLAFDAQLAARIRHLFPRRRRIIGRLNPFTWLAVR
jgi:transglutaminase-like putative cysteine protease